jgi:dCTP deaminase
MILTGRRIASEVAAGAIVISDFSASRVNPNSYNYRLGHTIKVYGGSDQDGRPLFTARRIPEEGLVLYPGHAYLGVTEEIIGSSVYAMSLIGRSSVGRYGLFMQISANLGHTTSCHRWTLELYACRPIVVCPRMEIGQVSFWKNFGSVACLGKTYARFNEPMEQQQ